jgi:hypothetical protein
MHLYLKYQSPNTFSSKDIVQLKVYQTSDKMQGHKEATLVAQWFERRVLLASRVRIPMWNMGAGVSDETV